MAKIKTTIKDIALKAGVSLQAISHALNGTGRLAPETRKRIIEIARELGYRKNHAASMLRSGENRTIGVVFPSLQMYLYELMIPLEKAFRMQGYSLIYTFFDRSTNYLKEFAVAIEHLLSLDVTAIITPTFEYVPETQVPIILWGNDVPQFDCVFPDKIQYGHDAINLLWEMGHRRFGAAGIMGEIRYKAMREALQMHGSHFCMEYHTPIAEEPRQSGISAIRHYLSTDDKPSVILFHSDEMAIAALGEALRNGIKVPEQLSIVGADNISAYKDIIPSLATFGASFEQMANLLVEVTLNRLSHPEWPKQRRGILRHFIPGESLCEISDVGEPSQASLLS